MNGTKITLTGIPQIDYVWDPNLPRELNGYEMSKLLCRQPFLNAYSIDSTYQPTPSWTLCQPMKTLDLIVRTK